MLRKEKLPDPKITRNVSQQLSVRGLRPPCRITVQCRDGQVTLSGSVQTLQQKQTAGQAARGVDGVRSVVDRLQIKAGGKWQ